MHGVQDYYDKTAQQWAENGYSEDGRLPCQEEFYGMLPPGCRVLDLCCGAGYESTRLACRGFQPVGVDFSSESLHIARERNPGIPFYQQDMLQDYSCIGPVDAAVLIAGLVHIQTENLPLAFQRLAQVVRPGGMVLISIREGEGKLDEWSLRRIDGEEYDRCFIAHTLAELTAASQGLFSYRQELPSDMLVWHYYAFQRESEFFRKS